MYDKIGLTENTLRVLSLFTTQRDRYIREVHRILNISPHTAQTILEYLEGKGVLTSKTRGKIKLYALQSNATKYVVLAEQYKAIAFLERSLLIKEAIEKVTPVVDGIGLIFGSYAKGTERPDSDLDIFIAGTYDSEEIEKVSHRLGIEIHVQCYPVKTFFEKFFSDFLLREIMKHHVIFVNAELFVEAAYGQNSMVYQ